MGEPKNKISISKNQKGNGNANKWTEWACLALGPRNTKTTLVWKVKETKIAPGKMGDLRYVHLFKS